MGDGNANLGGAEQQRCRVFLKIIGEIAQPDFCARGSGELEIEPGALARLSAMKRDNPRLKMMASVGGWTGSGPFSNMASTAASRAKKSIAAGAR